jgi:DNA-directed RNA polymerase specialized sigma24 family protein
VLRLEGLNGREIADVLGLTENSVAVRLTRARAALARRLEPAGDRS